MKSFKLFALTLCLFSYSLAGLAKTIVVSDIDDTIKKANSMGGIGGVWHFLRKKPYEESRDLFNEIRAFEISKGEKIDYYYVSAAPSYTFNGEEWIEKHRFPKGKITLKTRENGGATYDYKYRTIKAILLKELKNDPVLKVIFFGDNSAHDAVVYSDLAKELNLVSPLIYVRDVSTEATYFDADLPVKKIPGVDYFFSERELLDNSYFSFMSEGLKKLIISEYQKRELIPLYTFDTLFDRLKGLCEDKLIGVIYEEDKSRCKDEAKKDANTYWRDYYSRF